MNPETPPGLGDRKVDSVDNRNCNRDLDIACGDWAIFVGPQCMLRNCS